jgi:hypothetical protein
MPSRSATSCPVISLSIAGDRALSRVQHAIIVVILSSSLAMHRCFRARAAARAANHASPVDW